MSMSLLLGWGLMRGIKIPHQDFALKMQGGAYAQGGVFSGHYGIYMYQGLQKGEGGLQNERVHFPRVLHPAQ